MDVEEHPDGHYGGFKVGFIREKSFWAITVETGKRGFFSNPDHVDTVNGDRHQMEILMSAKVNERVTIHRGRTFTLLKENLTLENGVTVDLEIIRHPGASAIVPLSGDNTVILIKQYRHAIGDFIWEIPAGTLQENEAPLECAKRELIEETGFSAGTWQKLGEITPVPGYADERIHLFLACELEPAEQNLDKDEMIRVHEIGLEDAMEMIYQGTIQDGKTTAALFLAKHWLQQNQWTHPPKN